jgi:hypothetical protein
VIELVRASLARDPSYTYARAALAWILFSPAINGHASDPSAAIAEGDRHLRRALEGDVEDPLLNVEGIALIIGAHPDPDKAAERLALLREYWPGSPVSG